MGLDQIDRQYLTVLAQDSPLPLNVISAKLGLPSQTICNVVEPYLIKTGFIAKAKNSMRILTKPGKSHLETVRPSKVM